MEEADELIKEYPWLEEIYREVAALRKEPEEVLGMYSEALRIMDRNTVRYMIEEQQKEIEEQQKEIEEQQKEIEEKQKEIEEQKRELRQKDMQIQERDAALEKQNRELEILRQQMEQSQQ